MIFSLLQIETFNGLFFSIGYLELDHYNGALIHFGKYYSMPRRDGSFFKGKWEWDLLYSNIIKMAFKDWLDKEDV